LSWFEEETLNVRESWTSEVAVASNSGRCEAKKTKNKIKK